MWFSNRRDSFEINFSTRAEAFSYMLKYMIDEKKVDPMEAANKANEFAEIFSINMGIPIKIEPELKGVDKYISMAEKIGSYLDAHPKLLDYGIPVATFIAGLVTERKIDSSEHPGFNCPTVPPKEPIDFDKIPD